VGDLIASLDERQDLRADGKVEGALGSDLVQEGFDGLGRAEGEEDRRLEGAVEEEQRRRAWGARRGHSPNVPFAVGGEGRGEVAEGVNGPGAVGEEAGAEEGAGWQRIVKVI
jgi:hypothetical protein